MSHQVGLVWQGGNGVDDLLREQMEMVTKNNNDGVENTYVRVYAFVQTMKSYNMAYI